MLPKTARLSAQQVREVLKEGRSLRAGAVSAKYLSASRAGLPYSRPQAAVVVSKKTAKTAVVRNRLRRAAYEALKGRLPRARVVFFIHTQAFEPKDLHTLCSKLT